MMDEIQMVSVSIITVLHVLYFLYIDEEKTLTYSSLLKWDFSSVCCIVLYCCWNIKYKFQNFVDFYACKRNERTSEHKHKQPWTLFEHFGPKSLLSSRQCGHYLSITLTHVYADMSNRKQWYRCYSETFTDTNANWQI